MTEELQERETLHPLDPSNAARIAMRLTRRGITPGDIARLKRMNPRHPTEKTFWENCIALGIDQASENLVKTWAEIFSMIAKGTKVTELGTTGPHEGDTPLGKALARTGYKEERFKTLMNADESSVVRMLDRATAQLYANGQKFNWNDAARLAMTRHRSQDDRERDRMRITRDYYREAQQERTGRE